MTSWPKWQEAGGDTFCIIYVAGVKGVFSPGIPEVPQHSKKQRLEAGIVSFDRVSNITTLDVNGLDP